MNIRFLSLSRVLQIQRESIDVYGGDPGVRDMGLLESAIAQPRAAFAGQFLHEDLPTMAAAYLYHLVMNHPFVDGNWLNGGNYTIYSIQIGSCRVTNNLFGHNYRFGLLSADGSVTWTNNRWMDTLATIPKP